MSTVRVLYATIEGNTQAFIDKLDAVARQAGDQLDAQLIGDETEYAQEERPFVVIVPTYLTGGTGDGPEVEEIMTNALGEYVEFGHNRQLIKGVIGAGNRNFNVQYVLTGKRYAEKFGVPLIADFELRGNKFEIPKIYAKIKAQLGEN
ncbi:class Ib ribonucleoside-diphosphate reductase assembly flavoprotein NrdI [Leuconostocaceae bacterium ESL0723]|nr:class Ib ribonucleoside-diphosphate reductase assembly flavoprotein NrdI [Leuconostocaceae bacterium ESL0723]